MYTKTTTFTLRYYLDANCEQLS